MKEIPLTQGKIAIVDDEDYEWVSRYKWCATKKRNTWYAVRGRPKVRNKTPIQLHREVMNAPNGMLVDHIDGDGLNCQRSNLRLATNAQNLHNRGKAKNNTSGYKGVCRQRQNNNWTARIQVNGRSKHIGCFDTAEEAARAYDEVARNLLGEFARTNF